MSEDRWNDIGERIIELERVTAAGLAECHAYLLTKYADATERFGIKPMPDDIRLRCLSWEPPHYFDKKGDFQI